MIPGGSAAARASSMIKANGQGAEAGVLLAADDGPAVPSAAFPAAPGTGATISGVVMDTKGALIAEAHVSIENMDLLLLPEPVKFGAQTRRVMRPDSTRTDAKGHFHLTNLAPGKTTLAIAELSF